MTSLVMTTPDSETSDSAGDNTNEDRDVMTDGADVATSSLGHNAPLFAGTEVKGRTQKSQSRLTKMPTSLKGVKFKIL